MTTSRIQPDTYSPSAPTTNNVAAIVVLFNPEGDLCNRLRDVQRQVACLFAVANDDGGAERLNALDLERLRYIQNPGNIGLAAALNKGINAALLSGYEWCLLLDQDTTVDRDIIAGLAGTWADCTERVKIGILVPNYRSSGGARTAYPTQVSWQTVSTAVTSGSLISRTILLQLGGMREAFFIEGIDVEYCLRVRAAGLWVIASGRPLMTHGAGRDEERRFLWRTVLVGHHPPWRCFLQYRNLTWNLLAYGRTDPAWAINSLLAMFKRMIVVSIFERQRPQKLLAMLHGMGSGVWQRITTNSRQQPTRL